MLSPVFAGEALADAWLAEAQASMAGNSWEDAETPLSNVSNWGWEVDRSSARLKRAIDLRTQRIC